jgi:signal transduction histidine kinase
VGVQLNQRLGLIHPLSGNEMFRPFLFWSAYAVVIFLVILIFEWYGKINDSLREHAYQESKNKDRFIARASHEIKVSFQSVFAIVAVLYKIEKRIDYKGFKDAIDDLRAACKSTSNIIDNIFEYERYKAGRKPILREQLVNIRGSLKNIVDIYQHFANEKNVTVKLTVSDSIAYHIVADEMKLRQIVTNLLHNAIKFTNNDTTVRVDVSLCERQLYIVVRDSGDGIAWDIKELMFEPFVTQNPNGLGLGLYIVRELILALKGSIEVFNNPTGGATVIVSWQLPGLEAYRAAALVMQ